MPTFGDTSLGSYVGGWEGYYAASKFTLTEDALVEKLTFYIDVSSGSLTVYGAIYTDGGSDPTTRLALTDGVVRAVSGGVALDLPFASPVALSAGTYWLAAGGVGAGTASIGLDAVAGGINWKDGVGAAPPSPWGTTGGTDVGPVNVYATYTAASSAPTVKPDWERNRFPFMVGGAMGGARRSAARANVGGKGGPHPAGSFERFLFPRLRPIILSSGVPYAESPADTLDLADNVTFELTKAAEDTLSLADELLKDFGKLVEDTVSLADLAATAKVIPLSADDTLSLSDSAALLKAIGVEFGDTVTPSDSFTFERGVSATDSVSLVDAVVFDRGVLLSEGVSLADLAVFAREMLFADVLALSDGATQEITKNVSVNDSISLADAFDRVMDYQRSPSEPLPLSDSTSTAKETPLNPADSVGLADSAATAKEIPLSPADTLNLADSTTFTVDKTLALADTLSLSDSQAFERFLAVQDALSLADALAISYGLSAADVVGLADLADPVNGPAGVNHSVTPSDSVSLADAFSFIRSLGPGDSVTVIDSHMRQLNGIFLSDGSVAVAHKGIIYIGRF